MLKNYAHRRTDDDKYSPKRQNKQRRFKFKPDLQSLPPPAVFAMGVHQPFLQSMQASINKNQANIPKRQVFGIVWTCENCANKESLVYHKVLYFLTIIRGFQPCPLH